MHKLFLYVAHVGLSCDILWLW